MKINGQTFRRVGLIAFLVTLSIISGLTLAISPAIGLTIFGVIAPLGLILIEIENFKKMGLLSPFSKAALRIFLISGFVTFGIAAIATSIAAAILSGGALAVVPAIITTASVVAVAMGIVAILGLGRHFSKGKDKVDNELFTLENLCRSAELLRNLGNGPKPTASGDEPQSRHDVTASGDGTSRSIFMPPQEVDPAAEPPSVLTTSP